MPANFEPNPQDPRVNGIADEIELDGLLSLASALQARDRRLEDDSCSEVTTDDRRLSVAYSTVKDCVATRKA